MRGGRGGRRVSVLRLACLTALAGWLGCATTFTPADSPATAYLAFQEAVRSKNRESLWHALDDQTRALWRLAWRARRAGFELLATFPADEIAADPDLRVLGTTPPLRPEDLFAASVTDAELVRLGEDINPAAPVLSLVSEAQFPTKMGDNLPFRKAADRSWGYAGFADRAGLAARGELEAVERVGRLARQRQLRD